MTDDLFATSVRRAIAGDLSLVDLIGTAERIGASGHPAHAVTLYRAWVLHNAAHPLAYAALFNLASLLDRTGNPDAAREALEHVIRVKPDFAPAHINLGGLLDRAGKPGEAVGRWLHLVALCTDVTGDRIEHKAAALKQIGRVLEQCQQGEAAESVLRQGLELDPHQREVIQHWIAQRQGRCVWPPIEPFARLTRTDLLAAISPLSAAVLTDDPVFQLANAHRYHLAHVARVATHHTVGRWPPPEAPRGRRLRIGYVSSDLRRHAVGFLMAEALELHDRARVEVFAYYCGIPGEDPHQDRIRAAVEHWRDIATLTDTQAAARIVDDGIDILVDVNGYTKDARLGLFGLRPAPIIVNWLGYPGTMATPHHHYIIADAQVLPEGHERYFTERVLRLPCYQPNDRRRVIAAETPTRAEAGLPTDAVVFCCFNGSQKITAAVFALWLRILHRVPGSVLWLLDMAPDARDRLRAVAVAAGIAPERLVFAPKAANPDHLARYPLADLFLDTFPYGAHTTASDALWMGLPVLTRAGRGFAARVCASLVHAAGLPDMICADPETYVDRAVALGTDSAARAALRDRLRAGRDRCALFDTPSLVRHLEALYAQMWDEYAAGRLPEPDITNLPLYHEIGVELAAAALDRATAPTDADYRTRLAYADSIAPLRADARLWPGRHDHRGTVAALASIARAVEHARP